MATDQHVLVYVPEPGKPGVRLAKGDWDLIQTRWVMADKRLRKVGWPGYVAVRSADDPWCHGWPNDIIAARLAVLVGDLVEIDKWANTYTATIIKAGPLTVEVTFSTSTTGKRSATLPLLRPARWGKAYRYGTSFGRQSVGEVLIGGSSRAQVLAAHL